MSSSKKIYQQIDFAAGVYLSETQNPIHPHITHCICVYSILILTGKGGVETEKRVQGQQGRIQVTQLG
jgi:hypothetical protein